MVRLFTEDGVRQIVAEAVAPLKARIAELEAENARLKKNSTNSSKPPSSDIVKPPRPAPAGGKQRKRRGGGQPHHPRHTRPLFPPTEVDKTWVYEWETVPTGWKPLKRFRVVQQVELVENRYHNHIQESVRSTSCPVLNPTAVLHHLVCYFLLCSWHPYPSPGRRTLLTISSTIPVLRRIPLLEAPTQSPERSLRMAPLAQSRAGKS